MSPAPRPASFQTKTVLRHTLAAAGIAPRKRYGQHFLIDRNLTRKLIDAAELDAADCVLEVGAGTGSLTSELARIAGRVVAVEIDAELSRLAGTHLAELGNVTLIRTDALENKSTIAPTLRSAVARARTETRGPLKMVANLPYDIATPLVLNLLLGDLPFQRLCFTVQAEVADRFLAGPDTGAYGPVGVITQVMASGRRICKVSRRAFWPVPKVDSAMLCLDVRSASEVPIADPSAFAGFVRSFFRHRRKTITHTARRRDDAEQVLAAIATVGLEPAARPENVSVRHWTDLFRAVR